jgi:hypothetical protein
MAKRALVTTSSFSMAMVDSGNSQIPPVPWICLVCVITEKKPFKYIRDKTTKHQNTKQTSKGKGNEQIFEQDVVPGGS